MRKMMSLLAIVAIIGVFAIAGCSLPGASYQGGGANGSGKGPALINLRSAAGINGGTFAILAKTLVSSTGATTVTGDLGLSPAATSVYAGFGTLTAGLTFQTSGLPNAVVVGKIYAADMKPPTPTQMTTVIGDMQTAYVDAAGRAIPDATELYAGDLSGRTLPPGLYKWSSGVLINTPGVTLSGGANDTWVFQIAQNLTMGPGASVTLAGGAQASHITWQVGGGVGVTLNDGAHLEGTILAAKAIVLITNATVNGRLFAQSAVTMQANVVTAQ
jgi:Ice-binding-like